MRSGLMKLVAVTTAATMLIVACGDDDETATSSDTPGTTSDTTETTPAPATTTESEGTVEVPTSEGSGADTTTPAPTGEPIRVMTIGPFSQPAIGASSPELPGAVEARAAAINANGGVAGRPVEVIVCDTENDPNTGAACARDAVDDGIVAVVGNWTTTEASTVYPILEEAGIPSVQTLVVTPEAGLSPTSFSFINLLGLFSGPSIALAEAGATKLALIYPADYPGAQLSEQFWRQGAEAAGIEAVNAVAVPAGSVDLSVTVASAAANGVDGFVVALVGDQQGQLIRAIKQQMPSALVAANPTTLDPALIRSLGDDAEGLLLAMPTAPPESDAEGAVLFREDMAAYDDSLALTPSALSAWLGLWIVEQLLAEGTDVSSEALMASLSGLTDFDVLDILPPLDTTTPADLGGLPFTRQFTTAISIAIVTDGSSVPFDTIFRNGFTGAEIGAF